MNFTKVKVKKNIDNRKIIENKCMVNQELKE